MIKPQIIEIDDLIDDLRLPTSDLRECGQLGPPSESSVRFGELNIG